MSGSIINTRHARARAADVIKNRFDDVGVNAKLAEPGGACSSQIVHPPFRDPDCLIEAQFCLGPPTKPAMPHSENMLAAVLLPRLQDSANRGGQGYCMRPAVLRARRWK